MGEQSALQPKTLARLQGVSLYDRIIKTFGSARVECVAVVGGYRSETLCREGITLFENRRWSETNMVSSLLCASSWLIESACIVSYGDIFYSLEALEALARSSADISISYDPHWEKLWRRRFSDPLDDAETFRITESGRLVEIGGRPVSTGEVEGQYMGLLRFTPEGWRQVSAYLTTLGSAIDHLDMTGLLSRLVATGLHIEAIPYSGSWGEVDHPEDLALYETMLSEGELPGV